MIFIQNNELKQVFKTFQIIKYILNSKTQYKTITVQLI